MLPAAKVDPANPILKRTPARTEPEARSVSSSGTGNEIVKLGISSEGRVIEAYACSSYGPCRVAFLGGMHGDEPKSVTVARRLLGILSDAKHEGRGASWAILPLVNPDGYERRIRRNARGVDINRNFPASNWIHGNPRSRSYGGPTPASEVETRCVIELINRFQPSCIVTIHSIDMKRQCNNFDGGGRDAARTLARYNGYPVNGSIGYPTPGSFGNWAGIERGIPTVTLELPSHHSPRRCWEENRDGLLALLGGR